MHVLGLATVAVLAYAPQGAGGEARIRPVVVELERLLRADGHRVLPSDQLIAEAERERGRGWVAAARLGFFERIRVELEAGQHELERVELVRAEGRFARAEELCREEVAQPGVASLWAEAALGRGLALFEQGRREEAERAFRRALALEPGSALTEAHVRPDVARAFARVRTAKGALVSLTVEAGGAEVRVDGVRTEGPVRVAIGEHLVEARRGGQRAAVLVELRAAARLELSLPVDGQLATLAGLVERPSLDGIELLAQELGVEEVVAVAVGDDGGAVVRGVRIRPGCATESVLTRSVAALWSRLATMSCDAPSPEVTGGGWVRADQLRVVDLRPKLGVVTVMPPKRKAWWKRPWLWLGIAGASVVVVGLAAGLVTQRPTYDATLDGAAFSH